VIYAVAIGAVIALILDFDDQRSGFISVDVSGLHGLIGDMQRRLEGG
jgi:hypothetical protein